MGCLGTASGVGKDGLLAGEKLLLGSGVVTGPGDGGATGAGVACSTGAGAVGGGDVETGTVGSAARSTPGAGSGVGELGGGGVRSPGSAAARPSVSLRGVGAGSGSASNADCVGRAAGRFSSSRSALPTANEAAKRATQATATASIPRRDTTSQPGSSLSCARRTSPIRVPRRRQSRTARRFRREPGHAEALTRTARPNDGRRPEPLAAPTPGRVSARCGLPRVGGRARRGHQPACGVRPRSRRHSIPVNGAPAVRTIASSHANCRR